MTTIQCHNCSKVYRLPAERLPKGKRLAITCPNCKERIVIDPGKTRSPAPAGATDPGTDPHALKQKILESVQDLPPMPRVILKVQKIMADPNSGLNELTAVIKTDQAIANRMIKLANSPYYGLSGTISSVQKATAMLGQNTLREVLMTAGYSGLLDKTLEGYGYESGDLWRHSIAVGVAARTIADITGKEDKEAAYLAGLIHDSGKLILDPQILERKAQFDALLADDALTTLEAERQLFGFDHADIASEVCRRWQVPEAIFTAVGRHHNPSGSSGHMAYILNLADHIARTGGMGYGDDDFLYPVAPGTAERLQMTPETISEISAKVIESVLALQG